jgi:hypothetical protein
VTRDDDWHHNLAQLIHLLQTAVDDDEHIAGRRRTHLTGTRHDPPPREGQRVV